MEDLWKHRFHELAAPQSPFADMRPLILMKYVRKKRKGEGILPVKVPKKRQMPKLGDPHSPYDARGEIGSLTRKEY